MEGYLFPSTYAFDPDRSAVYAIDTMLTTFMLQFDNELMADIRGSAYTWEEIVTMASIIEKVQKPTLVLAHNKTLAAQLYGEMKEFTTKAFFIAQGCGPGGCDLMVCTETLGMAKWSTIELYDLSSIDFSDIDGQVNMNVLRNYCQDLSYFPAAQQCAQKGSDWYLPSVEEFKNIYGKYFDMFPKDQFFWTSTYVGRKYYKDENGRLIRQVEDEMRILYNEEFFVICAIDESYIYILKPNENGNLSMIRVSKEKGTNKEILSDVRNVLCSDDENIYYSDNADPTIINKFNRETERTTQFCDFEDTVELMREQYAQFYIVTSSGYSFFGSDAEYFYVDKNGNITRELGSNPDVLNMSITSHGNFNEASMMVGSGYLRNTASSIYWLSADKSSHVLTECVSGWNPSNNVGIFTTLNNDDYSDGALPYRIVLYAAKDGTRKNVTTVNSNQAFFTLTQSDAGDWYFMDETDEYLILYTMDENFSSKTELRRFSKSEINYSLTECSMEIKDNCLYFFTIPDDSICKVLKRYNVC